MRADAAAVRPCFIIPFLRNFYELSTPDGDVVAAWALGTVVGIGACLERFACCGFERRAPRTSDPASSTAD
jgi:hypothetical protein